MLLAGHMISATAHVEGEFVIVFRMGTMSTRVLVRFIATCVKWCNIVAYCRVLICVVVVFVVVGIFVDIGDVANKSLVSMLALIILV